MAFFREKNVFLYRVYSDWLRLGVCVPVVVQWIWTAAMTCQRGSLSPPVLVVSVGDGPCLISQPALLETERVSSGGFYFPETMLSVRRIKGDGSAVRMALDLFPTVRTTGNDSDQ